MRRAVIASIIGIAASAATSFGQANFIFETYAAASYAAPQGVVTWTTDTSLAPPGKAGLAVEDSEGFKADLLWQVGTAGGDLGLAVPTIYGWIMGPPVSFMSNYAGQSIDFTILVWQGADYNTATVKGSITWTEPGVTPGGTAGYFQNLPKGPIIVSFFPPGFVQPTDQTVPLGGTATFSCGSITNSCQWRFNGQPIPGANTSTLVLTNAQLTDAGNYSVVVSITPTGVFVISNAVLQVLPAGAPSIQVNNRLAVGTVWANGSALVTISGGFTNGFIFYTLDGSTPTTTSPLYSGSMTLTNSGTVQAMSLSADFRKWRSPPPLPCR